jgi:hypothetical protein
MSEADRVFPARRGQGAQTLSSEKRFIQSRHRRGEVGSGQPRVVEVVHVRRGTARLAEESSRPPVWSVRAETWPDGFHAKPSKPSPEPPIVPQPAAPVGHVMGAWWEPVPPKAVPPSTPSDQVPAEAVVTGQRKSRTRKTASPPAVARAFADPFAAEEEGANCLRCGYLVEPARERRGLLTCAACG